LPEDLRRTIAQDVPTWHAPAPSDQALRKKRLDGGLGEKNKVSSQKTNE
jgi:hypothetical protein